MITTLFIIIISLIIFARAQSSTENGCCCDLVGETGSILTSANCASLNRVFYPLTSIAQLNCDSFCKTQPPAPGTSTTPTADCSNPTTRMPAELTITPIKGQLGLRLEFTLNCPTDLINISRCEGATCTNFKQIALLPTQFFYEDKSSLKWSQDYTYKIIAKSSAFGDSQPATATANTGDIECWYQNTDNQFCVDASYYTKYEDYLKTNGYTVNTITKTAQDFTSTQSNPNKFEQTIMNLFNGRFKKAFRCDGNNKISTPTLTCTTGQACISSATTTACADTTSQCSSQDNIFGLFSTADTCEGTTQKKYCFIDKSFSIVDTCYTCNSRMSCYDYKSENACTRNNCGIGQCTWKPVFEDIGTGVCIDERFNNCPTCGQQGTTNAPNKQAYNEIFDQCTEEKAKALSTNSYTCFKQQAQDGTTTAISCDTITCRDYTKAQCAADSRGVTLNSDNSVAAHSNDVCKINVCQWGGDKTEDGIGCVKNADATPATTAGWQDCDDIKCERDYFPPQTSILPTGTGGRVDFLLVNIFDKLNKTSDVVPKQGTPGYNTFLCANIATGTPCSNFAQTNSTKLNINDETLKLQEGTKPILDLHEGYNKIRFYSKDTNKNLEVIKPLLAQTTNTTTQAQTRSSSNSTEIIIHVCKNCSGPKLIDFLVSHARLDSNTGVWYTSDVMPIITISFNKQSDLISYTLNSTNMIPLSRTPQTKDMQFMLSPTSAQQALTEGPYTLIFNAQDNGGRVMDEQVLKTIFVKTSQARVQITPADKAVLTTNTAVITLNFSEQVTLKKVIVQEEILIGDYIKRINNIDITNNLTSSNNKTYTTTLNNLVDGQKNIIITAEDITGAQFSAKSSFYTNTQPTKIILSNPRLGIASRYTFNITAETTTSRGTGTTPAITCKWSFDDPIAPPISQFDTLANFDSEYDNKHVIKNFNRITSDDTSNHNFYVYCKDSKGTTQKTFQLSVDTVKPNIIDAFAWPNPILEELYPNSGQYLTTLKVQTDKQTFCKYSKQPIDFDSMEEQFPGYGETPATTNLADLIVTQLKNHTYYMQCQSIAGILSQPKQVSFNINTNVQFAIKSTTPKFANSTSFTLSAESNKRARCYYNTQPTQLTDCMGECNFTTAHIQPVSVSQQGNTTFYIQCSRGATGEVSPILPIKIFVDNTPPKMTYVNDTSLLLDTPEISPYTDKLWASFLGTDDETDVTQYLISIEQASTGNFTMNWAPSTHTDGKQFLLPEAGTLNLLDKERYILHVKPVNLVGLAGEEMKSDGVTTDFSKKIPGKTNGERCQKDQECISNYCTLGVCSQASCTDQIKNGLETDVDCGNGCQKCEKEKKCRVTSDCKTGLACSSGKCQDLGPCYDAILSDTETDVDCGGACSQKCAEGNKCRETKDCESGAYCIQNTCTKTATTGDTDQDGVQDETDKCPNTNLGEKVDDNGCADSQKFSLGDEIPDSWRMKYFKCIDCSEAAAEADPDSDELTNLEEFKAGTDPTNQSSPGKAKSSILAILLWTLLTLLILGGAGLGGYMLYQYYTSTKQSKQPMRVVSVRQPFGRQVQEQSFPTQTKKLSRKPWLSDKIDALRKYIQPKEEGEEKGWLSIPQLHKETEITKKQETKEANGTKQKQQIKPQFEKLKELVQKAKTKNKESSVKIEEQQTTPFQKLIQLARKTPRATEQNKIMPQKTQQKIETIQTLQKQKPAKKEETKSNKTRIKKRKV